MASRAPQAPPFARSDSTASTQRLERGRTPVLECTYSRREQRDSLLRALAGHPARFWVVELGVSAEDAVARFLGRRQASDLDERVVYERAQTFPPSDQALRLASEAKTVQDTARQIESWLQGPPPAVDRASWAATGKE